jgi:hypothetical protein
MSTNVRTIRECYCLQHEAGRKGFGGLVLVLMTNKSKGRKSHFGRASVSVPVQKAKAPCLLDLICSLNHSLQMLITRDPGSCEIATTALKKIHFSYYRALYASYTTRTYLWMIQKAKKLFPNRGIEPRPCRCFFIFR